MFTHAHENRRIFSIWRPDDTNWPQEHNPMSMQGHREVKSPKSNGLVAEQIHSSTPTSSHSDCDMDIRNQFSNLLYDFPLKSLKVWFINHCCIIFLSLSIQFSSYTVLKTVFQTGYTIPTLNFQLFTGNVPLKLVCSSKMLIQVSLELKPLSIFIILILVQINPVHYKSEFQNMAVDKKALLLP